MRGEHKGVLEHSSCLLETGVGVVVMTPRKEWMVLVPRSQFLVGINYVGDDSAEHRSWLLGIMIFVL